MPTPTLLRNRDDDGTAAVDNSELFFDLVFVFAVTQLSHALIAAPTAEGALRVTILFLAVWWSWVGTSWVTNWLDPSRTSVRLLLFALMAAGLFMAMALPSAWNSGGLVFAAALALLESGRSLFMLWALRGGDSENVYNFRRILTWSIVAGALWLVGGIGDPGPRLGWWGAAAAIMTLGPMAYFWTPGLGRSRSGDWDIDGRHLAERCGLFVIIALGESILVTGATASGAPWDEARLAGFATAFVAAIAMWWLYFNIAAERGGRHIEEADDPGRIGRTAYTYAHIPLIAGIITTAAGDELVLAHPHAHGGTAAAVVWAGPTAYLVGAALFKRLTGGWFPLSHLVGIGVLVPLALLAGRISLLGASAAGSALLFVVACWETASLRSDEAKAPRAAI